MEPDVETIRRMTERHWGERCEEFEKLCPTCRAWVAFDVLTEFMKEGE